MTGKQLKELVATIPDNAKVGVGYNESKDGEYIQPDLIIGATVQTVMNFPDCEFFPQKAESTIIFEVKGVEP